MNEFNIPMPEELEKRLAAKDEGQLKDAVPKIMAELEKKYVGSPVTVSDFNLSEKARERLIALFNEKGWKVVFHSDQRDGNSFTFSRK